MRSTHRAAAALGLALALTTSTACFHAIVDTGRPAGATVIQKPWVNTFIFGLVGALTLGIYTPQSATITCAAAGTALLVPRGATVVAVADDATSAVRTAALRDAATESARTGHPVYVRF